MPSQRERLAKARRERGRVEEALAKNIAKLERLEHEQEAKRVKREKLGPDDVRDRERLNEILRELAREVEALERRVEELTPRARRLGRRVARLARKVRNSLRPTVKDLDLDRGSTSSAMGPITASVGHYTAGALATSDEQAIRLWHLVDSQHRAQGWAMIGYHVGLGPEGGVYLLRPLRFAGAHTAGYNTGYVGFSVHGTTGHTWTRAQLRAFRFALKKFGLADKRVYGHNDLNATACPGSFKSGYVNKGL